MTVDHDKLPDIPVFKYIPDGDFFIADQDYAHVCDLLELGEWNRVVWIGRLSQLTQAGIDRALVEEVTENLDSGMKVYIEKNTKKIRCLPANDLFFEAELWQDEIDAIDAGDFWEVTPMQSFQSYKIMEDYIPLVEDQQLSNRLAQAIDKRKPFRHFKAIIDDSGVYGNRWFEFKTKRYAEYVVNELIGLISR